MVMGTLPTEINGSPLGASDSHRGWTLTPHSLAEAGQRGRGRASHAPRVLVGGTPTVDPPIACMAGLACDAGSNHQLPASALSCPQPPHIFGRRLVDGRSRTPGQKPSAARSHTRELVERSNNCRDTTAVESERPLAHECLHRVDAKPTASTSLVNYALANSALDGLPLRE